MTETRHSLLLEQAIQKFCLPDKNLAKIKERLLSEQEVNKSLGLRVAEAKDQSENASLLNELLRQKQESDLRIEALEYARSKHTFVTAFKSAQRQKRRAKRRSAKKSSNTTSAVQKASRDDRVPDGERRKMLDAYKNECTARGVKVTNTMIAKEAGWSDRTPVQRWLRNDAKSSPAEDARIRRVLRQKPHVNKS